MSVSYIPAALPGGVDHTDPSTVVAVVRDIAYPALPPSSQYQEYGTVPTAYRVKLSDNRWRRVYALSYGNGASVFVNVAGRMLFLDIDTEYALSDGLRSERLSAL